MCHDQASSWIRECVLFDFPPERALVDPQGRCGVAVNDQDCGDIFGRQVNRLRRKQSRCYDDAPAGGVFQGMSVNPRQRPAKLSAQIGHVLRHVGQVRMALVGETVFPTPKYSLDSFFGVDQLALDRFRQFLQKGGGFQDRLVRPKDPGEFSV